MNQKSTILLLCITMLGLSTNLRAQNPIPEVTEVTEDVKAKEMTAYFFETPPRIDGDLSEWIEAGAEFHFIGEAADTVRSNGAWYDADDRSVIFSYMWDADNLYFAAANYDDIFTSVEEWSKAWSGDCMYLWYNTSGALGPDNISVVLNFEDEPTLLSWGNAMVSSEREPYPEGETEIAIVMDEALGDAGNFVEFSLPLKYLKLDNPDIDYILKANIGLEEGNQDEDGSVFLAWKPLLTSQDMHPVTFAGESPNKIDHTSIKTISNNSLKQNYPNPFSSMTNIPFTVSQKSNVTLRIYNYLGQEIETLVNEVRSAGSYTVPFDAAGLNEGVYFYKLTQNNQLSSKKMVLSK